MIGVYMKNHIGTSGWNIDNSLEWCINNSTLNTIELNMDYYQYPTPDQVEKWSKLGSKIRWSINVNQWMMYYYKYDEYAIEAWDNFREIFKPLEPYIDFYLFQIPSIFKDMSKLSYFIEQADLGEHLAIELQNPTLLGDDEVCSNIMDMATLVSIDSRDFNRKIFATNKIYLRMLGRGETHNYDYNKNELSQIAEIVERFDPESSFIYFNNTKMLDNARTMKDLLI